MTVRFTFNCILIDKDGMHHVDLAKDDPIAALDGAPKEAQVEVPNPPIDVGVTA